MKIIRFILVRGGPELSTFSTYEITSHKREGGGCKNVENFIVLSSAIFLSPKNVDCLGRRGREWSKTYDTLSHKWKM